MVFVLLDPFLQFRVAAFLVANESEEFISNFQAMQLFAMPIVVMELGNPRHQFRSILSSSNDLLQMEIGKSAFRWKDQSERARSDGPFELLSKRKC